MNTVAGRINRSTFVSILLLYVLLGLGSLWHILGMFQATLDALAAPVMILLGVVAYLPVRHMWKQDTKSILHLDLWALFVIAGGFAVEVAGVKSGVIFGDYSYKGVLQPRILGVPIAIGFAWLSMLLSSMALAQRFFTKRATLPPLFLSLATALLMVLFDLLLESVADALHYWHWFGSVPAQNYVAWLTIGFVFAVAGTRIGLGSRRLPPLTVHVYIAQFLYFGSMLVATVLRSNGI